MIFQLIGRLLSVEGSFDGWLFNMASTRNHPARKKVDKSYLNMSQTIRQIIYGAEKESTQRLQVLPGCLWP